jgi:hypothetical protein
MADNVDRDANADNVDRDANAESMLDRMKR